MDNTHPTHQSTHALDEATELELTDPEVQTLYQNGYIGRPIAEVFNIIADFNDNGGQEGAVCSRS
jgi:hypothetical protein